MRLILGSADDNRRPEADLEEIVRLNELIRELLIPNNCIRSIYPYPADAVRHMIYGRVFGNGYGPSNLTQEEASTMMTFGGRYMTCQSVRDEILLVIETLVSTMVRNPDTQLTDNQARIQEWLEVSANIETDPTHAAVTQDVSPDALADSAEPEPEPAAGASNDLQSARPDSNQVHHSSDLNQAVSMSASNQNRTARGANAEPATGAQVSRPATLPTLTATNPPTYVTAGPMPMQGNMPFFQPVPGFWQHPNPYVLPQPGMNNGNWPIMSHAMPHPGIPFYTFGHHAAPYMHPVQPQFQQMGPMPNMARGSVHQVLPTSPYNGIGLPNPFVPLNRMAIGSGETATNPLHSVVPTQHRPANRHLNSIGTDGQLASDRPDFQPRPCRFNVAEWAQENRPPTPPRTSTSNTVRINPEWNNRFGGRNLNALAANPSQLPYRIGTDTMLQRVQAGASSAQLQQIINEGAPSFSTMTRAENVPFGRNLDGADPAPWGVVRIGNVSGNPHQ